MTDDKEIQVDINMTSNDFVLFQLFHMKKLNILSYWFVALFGSLGLILLYPPLWYYFLPVALLAAAGAQLLGRLALRWRARRDFKKDYTFRKEYSLDITKTGINQQSARSTSFFSWTEIRTAHKNKELYRLYIARTQAILIPARSFASAADREAFERLVSVKVPARGNKLTASGWPLILLNIGIGAMVIGVGSVSGILLTNAMEPEPETVSVIPSREAAIEQKSFPFAVDLPFKSIFSGENDTWIINEFEVLEQGDGFRITPGSFKMKGTDLYYTDYRNITIYMTLDRGPVALFESELEKPNTDITNLEFGPSNFTYYKNNRLPVEMTDIRELYVEILWRDHVTGGIKTSRVDLYPGNNSASNNYAQEPEEQALENPEVRKGDDLGYFIFASRQSPNLVNIIELREVQIADKEYATRSEAQRETRASVRIYYGRNGGILDQFVDYDPGGFFESEDFEVIWKSDWEATVNTFAADGTIDESFDIQLTE